MLQKRLNLKKIVTQPSSVRNSQTSGPTPRSATSALPTATSSSRCHVDLPREGGAAKGIGKDLTGLPGPPQQPPAPGSAQSAANGTGSPDSSLRAFIAARCSASFLFFPQAGVYF